MQNKYINRSHISEKKFREIIKYFAHDETSHKTAIYTGISRNTINRIFDKICKRICSLSANSSKDSGEFELDESYFGTKRVRGKRGRGAAGKTPVFGLLKRDVKIIWFPFLIPSINLNLLCVVQVNINDFRNVDS